MTCLARARDGYEFGGNRIRVELSRGSNREERGPRGERPPPPVPRTLEGSGTGFRATVTGLPSSASWQDLKVLLLLVQPAFACLYDHSRQVSAQDHFRKVAKPSFANVYRDRNGLLGVVEFESREVSDAQPLHALLSTA